MRRRGHRLSPDIMFLDSLFGNVSPVDKSPPSNVPLRAHAYDGARGRANESDALLRKAVGELGVLTEEAVTWVNGLSFGMVHISMLLGLIR